MSADRKQSLTSLSELARDHRLNVNKSKLAYYAKIGLIVPVSKVSNTQIYDKDEVIKTIKTIDRLQKLGLTLPEIKRRFEDSA